MHQVVRRGDYYEIQITEREVVTEPKKKAEEPNPNICTDNILQTQALNKFSIAPKLTFSDNRIVSLREELRLIERELQKDPKADEQDIKQTKNLLTHLADLETTNQVKVNVKEFKKLEPVKQGDVKPITYKLMLPVSTNLETRIKRLEDIEYPKLAKIQQLTGILIGENYVNDQKLTKSKLNSKVEGAGNLFNRYQKLELVIDEFPQMVSRINRLENVHCDIAETVSKFRDVTTLHMDMMEELSEEMALATKIAKNFEDNKAKLTKTIQGFKDRLAKLKKK